MIVDMRRLSKRSQRLQVTAVPVTCPFTKDGRGTGFGFGTSVILPRGDLVNVQIRV